MRLSNSTIGYGVVAVTLHWLIAALVLANIALGIWYELVMDPHDMARPGTIAIHKSIGLTVLALSLVRLAWRLLNPAPALPADMTRGWKFAAHSSHVTLYALMVLVPLAGWAQVSISPLNIPVRWFGLFVWPKISFLAALPHADKVADVHGFSLTHIVLAWAMTALVIGHIGAALYHHFRRRDQVLSHMLHPAA
jgi:cytochrome b561